MLMQFAQKTQSDVGISRMVNNDQVRGCDSENAMLFQIKVVPHVSGTRTWKHMSPHKVAKS